VDTVPAMKKIMEEQRLVHTRTVKTGSNRLKAAFLGVVRDVAGRVSVAFLMFLKISYNLFKNY
jgi:hypothetical protein